MTFHMNMAYIEELALLLCWGQTVDRRAVDKEHNFEDITSELEDRAAISQHEHNQQILHVLPKNVLHTSEAVRMASLRGHIEGDFTINNVAFLPITVVSG